MRSRDHLGSWLWCSALVVAMSAGSAAAQQNLHFTYMWHMEQPIYWPDRQSTSPTLGDQYERLAESLARAGAHPQNTLFDIFNKDDRVAAYQYRAKDSISAFAAFPSFGSVPEGGAQVSFSGGLIQNIQSVAGTGFIGGRYGTNWYDGYRQARSWNTQSGPAVPRCDMVLFPFHHALMPLVAESAMRRQIQTYKAIYQDAWGTAAAMSVGFFPSEMAFSTRMIGVLADEGVQWSIVSGEKISRACANWPVVFGSGGTPSDPPNRADQLNPAQADYFRMSIDRGCSPAEAYPFAFTPRRARYVDPSTGQIKSIVVVPSSQSLSWRDGYSAQGPGDFATLNARNDPSRPMLVVLSHDGDNDWGGGSSYYLEATPNRVRESRNAGFVPTVVQRYLADHPVPAGDFVHVEDGAWVNADSDFGSPQFWNWNWPLLNAAGQPDPVQGWHVDARNWAVITAMQNRVDTVEQMHVAGGGTVNPRRIVYPHEGANSVERAWHYFMGSLNSGYMYYGSAIDMEVKQSVACNNAARFTDPILSTAPATGPTSDRTGPTIWVPQRWPYNPGGQGFGNPYRQGDNYGPFVQPVNFTVWTFVADVSSTQSVTLKYRVDLDGQRSLANTENETYAGGPGVGAWISVPMNGRAFPAGNVYNDPEIDFFVQPLHIAEHYSAQITGQAEKLLDYYVEAVDSKGNVSLSPIQHVWVGDGQGGGPGPSAAVTIAPSPPVAGQSVIVTYDPTGRPLSGASSVNMYWGVNTWTGIQTTPMTRASVGMPWSVTVTLPGNATVLDLVFNSAGTTWDNNSGADWHIAVQPGGPVSGRCCVAGVCSVTLQSACSGVFTAGADCGGANCPVVALGSCCAGGGCAVTTQSACAATWTAGALCSPNPCPFVMDGVLDAGATSVATRGLGTLSAALRGDVLYVAGPMGAGTDDRFIYLASVPGAMSPAHWAKQGQIAGFRCFLASEGSGAYFGWQQQTAGATATQGRGSATGVLEGTINLRQELMLGPGPLPNEIWLAFAQYTTPDNGVLVATAQIPVGNGNGNIEPGEFVRVPICSLLESGCCQADFDRVDGLTVQDIFAFLVSWFAGESRADFDQSGALGVHDIFGFLAAWFSGCG
jgi:Starch/carbohydrate-binding module (family 53)/Glycosyl hydrolase family 57